MFNIGENTKIVGLEKIGCKVSHLQNCLHEKGKHEVPKYDYFGKFVSRGSILVHTKNGDFTLKFKERNGWAEYVEIEEIVR